MPSRKSISSELLSNAEILQPLEDDLSVTIDMHDYECDNDEIIQAYAKQFESKDERICPHEDIIEVINMGSEEEKKELKIVDNPEKEQMVELFREFIDVFAWS